MLSFFHSWRRKVGAVTLVMACVLLGCWTRSRNIVDSIETQTPAAHCIFVSGGGRFLFVIGKHSILQMRRSQTEVRLGVLPITALPTNSANIEWNAYPAKAVSVWPGNGAGPDASRYDGNERGMFDYWLIALPLTLLSAYLILWKPRKRTGPDHA